MADVHHATAPAEGDVPHKPHGGKMPHRQAQKAPRKSVAAKAASAVIAAVADQAGGVVRGGHVQGVAKRIHKGKVPPNKQTDAPPSVGPDGEVQTKPRKAHRRVRSGTAALRNIRKLQKSTTLLLRKAPFRRLVREIAQDQAPGTLDGVRFTREALAAIQEATEAYGVALMELYNLAAVRRGRVTIQLEDVGLVHDIGNRFPGQSSGRLGPSAMPAKGR